MISKDLYGLLSIGMVNANKKSQKKKNIESKE
jgi:hypothetical protein